MRLKISARKSDLARLQAYRVKDAIMKLDPDIGVEFLFRESLGDKNLTDPLWKSPEKGVFTEDFYKDLKQGETDIVVHSWKDLPTDEKSDTQIIATLPRADVRDILLFKKYHLMNLRSKNNINLQILSSSPRRAYNLTPFFKKHLPFQTSVIQFENVRGNIQTRVKKLLEHPDAQGLIVAKAALDRLLTAKETDLQETKLFLTEAMDKLDYMVLPICENPTAAGQGAIAIEALSQREDLKRLFSQVNCPITYQSVKKEREILKSYGGGCHQKIGVNLIPLATSNMNQNYWAYFLRGETDKGQILNQQKLVGSIDQLDVNSIDYDWKSQSLNQFIQTQDIPFAIPRDLTALYISKSTALPLNLNTENKLIWTPGITTWKALAEQGVWVHGCQEGLGESLELPEVNLLGAPLKWGRLTFADAFDANHSSIPHIATYKLNWPISFPDLSRYDKMYWSSAQHFIHTFEKCPEIANKKHYALPGRTYKGIHNYLVQRKLELQVQLNVHQGDI